MTKRAIAYSLLLFVLLVATTTSFAQSKKKKTTFSKATLLDKVTHFDVPVGGKPNISGAGFSFYITSIYGFVPSIDFRVNDDNTIDVLWVNDTLHLVRISLAGKHIAEKIRIPDVISGKFLGFESFDNGKKFVIGHVKENSFGQKSEAWYTAFTKEGRILFSTRIWGEKDLNTIDSKGSPADAGSAVIRYNPKNNLLGVYLAHTMKWPDSIRHQAGWIGFLDATTGAIKEIGNSWFYSHNFDQRLMVAANGDFYTLAHGDAYDRALALHQWSWEKGPWTEEFSYHPKEFKYLNIPGTRGDNMTGATTGDFAELSNGNIAIAFSTSIGRSSSDLKVVIVAGMNARPAIVSSNWLTILGETYVPWGTKIIQRGKQEILVGWNVFKQQQPFETFLQRLDLNGRPLEKPVKIENAVLSVAQSFQKTKDGKIVFVTANGDKLAVHVIAQP